MTIPETFFVGVEQLNTQQFYACHDTLEALWFEAMEPEKSLYQGILQIAVACYHLSNDNLRGATILMGEGLRRLRQTEEEVYGGLNLVDFIQQGEVLLASLQQLPTAEVTTFYQALQAENRFPRLNPV
ncbi:MULTISPECIES: DUF309 domain-containing protein [unclassified Picosynechococcus]|uniref:DUF309 domain-containing protein n=1 Tax=unclassified Picosynechococcus TaxID=3079910 RepID=UPI0007458817|nr:MULTISPECIES: DUF309 domain-containing protein [unclassified Picosynechococcus]AMA09520.1 hypothetical protein AWQ23_09435 [Picosynechococcus sp. PCC 73109]ANV87685.1 hypothetical protein AWQ22_09555 [Picosynechococcus sp. PCC 7117]